MATPVQLDRHGIGIVVRMTRDVHHERLQAALEQATRRTVRRLWVSLAVGLGGWCLLIALVG
jgi:hypothetical protein